MSYDYCATARGVEEHIRDCEDCNICKAWIKAGRPETTGKPIDPKPKKVKKLRRVSDDDRCRKAKARCGTRAGYMRHIKRGETPDRACKDAHNEYNRKLNEKRRRDKGIPERPKITEREHGTLTGFRQHLKHGEPPCDPCRLEKNAYNRIQGQKSRDRKKARANT